MPKTYDKKNLLTTSFVRDVKKFQTNVIAMLYVENNSHFDS